MPEIGIGNVHRLHLSIREAPLPELANCFALWSDAPAIWRLSVQLDQISYRPLGPRWEWNIWPFVFLPAYLLSMTAVRVPIFG
jgi:hypothetical protein